MKRHIEVPRADAKDKLEAIGFSFHSWDGYWNEAASYEFSLEQVECIEAATNELHQLCLNAVDRIVGDEAYLRRFGIPRKYWDYVRASWKKDYDKHLYGRFDLAWDGDMGVAPKMLEYNADTPTSLLESAVAQWYWMEEKRGWCDQFNSVHEVLIDRWRALNLKGVVHFASLADNEEDWVCVAYLEDTARQAGYATKYLTLDQIGYDANLKAFGDMDNDRIVNLFKLYPWEWIFADKFGTFVPESGVQFIEPAWKALLSNKALLPILWEFNKGHPNLLASYFDKPELLRSYAKKPILSREGANVSLVDKGTLVASADGDYGAEGYVYQQLCALPKFGDKYAVIGSWVVGNLSCGMCIREDVSPITTNMSNFVPHFFR